MATGSRAVAPSRITLSTLEKLIFNIHRIRVIFRDDTLRAPPQDGRAIDQSVIFDDDRYVSEFHAYMELVVPGIHYSIVTPKGGIDPHGNTKLRTVRFKKS